jgi:hypothetical protein
MEGEAHPTRREVGERRRCADAHEQRSARDVCGDECVRELVGERRKRRDDEADPEREKDALEHQRPGAARRTRGRARSTLADRSGWRAHGSRAASQMGS